jgi:RNA polymerase sigma-B factor
MMSSRQRDGSMGALSTNELARRWQAQQDEGARQELCDRFLPLACKLASRYRGAREPLEDLVQVASVGLLGAIDRFDPDRGVSFPSFAVPTILGELKRYFRDTGWSLHVPRGAQELALRVDRASREIAARSGRSPRIQELADHLAIGLEDVLIGLDAGTAHHAASLDAPLPGPVADEPQSLLDSLGRPEDGYGLVETTASLAEAINRLPYAERRAFRLRMEGGMKQIEIAQQLGCSQMQVSRLLRRAAARLRDLTGSAPSSERVAA